MPPWMGRQGTYQHSKDCAPGHIGEAMRPSNHATDGDRQSQKEDWPPDLGKSDRDDRGHSEGSHGMARWKRVPPAPGQRGKFGIPCMHELRTCTADHMLEDVVDQTAQHVRQESFPARTFPDRVAEAIAHYQQAGTDE